MANPKRPQVHVHKPGATIAQAIANAKAYVANVNKASRRK
jgi:fructose-specific component phosphotransferase system IIB-like protein